MKKTSITKAKLSLISDELVKQIASTNPIVPRFKQGQFVRLYKHQPRHIDDAPSFLIGFIIGINITTKPLPRYRLVFNFNGKWVTCNRYYTEKIIGKLHPGDEVVESGATYSEDYGINFLNELMQPDPFEE